MCIVLLFLFTWGPSRVGRNPRSTDEAVKEVWVSSQQQPGDKPRYHPCLEAKLFYPLASEDGGGKIANNVPRDLTLKLGMKQET